MNKAVVAGSALFLFGGVMSAAAMSPLDTQGTTQTTCAQTAPKLRQQIRDQLARAGLADIKIAPEEYVVHAKNKKGDPVVMVVSPNSFLEVTDVKVANSDDAPTKRTLVEPDPTPLADQR